MESRIDTKITFVEACEWLAFALLIERGYEKDALLPYLANLFLFDIDGCKDPHEGGIRIAEIVSAWIREDNAKARSSKMIMEVQ